MLHVLLAAAYAWGASAGSQPLRQRIEPPPGFEREAAALGSFAEWLRGLPLLPGRPPVLLFDGRPKSNQEAHAAVVDIDVGRRDLQQCADAVIRLRAEYLFDAGRAAEIAFSFTSGDRADFARWAQGWRPRVSGSHVTWDRSAPPNASHASLRRYLDLVFTYAGSLSLARELDPIADPAQVRAGDVFVEGGSPGHAVLVVDTARNREGRRRFLVVQSYMPAQQVHVLRNPAAEDPWYPAVFGARLVTPEWTFRPGHLRRFRE